MVAISRQKTGYFFESKICKWLSNSLLPLYTTLVAYSLQWEIGTRGLCIPIAV